MLGEERKMARRADGKQNGAHQIYSAGEKGRDKFHKTIPNLVINVKHIAEILYTLIARVTRQYITVSFCGVCESL